MPIRESQPPKRKTRIELWLSVPQPEGSLGHVIQAFLKNRLKKGLSPHTVGKLYYSLRPLAEHFAHTRANEITARALYNYQKDLCRKYAADTIRGITGDIR
ncbi:MAG: hypothetical protein OT477_12930 [Chloroflexi bacterium]|nr:hypothetical protein [Chloroflexota bacterium]